MQRELRPAAKIWLLRAHRKTEAVWVGQTDATHPPPQGRVEPLEGEAGVRPESAGTPRKGATV